MYIDSFMAACDGSERKSRADEHFNDTPPSRKYSQCQTHSLTLARTHTRAQPGTLLARPIIITTRAQDGIGRCCAQGYVVGSTREQRPDEGMNLIGEAAAAAAAAVADEPDIIQMAAGG